MRHVSMRRINRLEQLAQPYLASRLKKEEQSELKYWGAVGNAAILAFLIRHGNPRVEEPLSRAMERCHESAAWKQCCRRFEESLSHPPNDYPPFRPDSKDRVIIIGQQVRHFVISSFRGADEKRKLDAAFAAAPPWLIWFTYADYTAALLGLSIPDLTSVSKFVRPKENFYNWWGLPTGAFERKLWPHGPEHERFAHSGLDLVRPEEEPHATEMTPREQKRQLRLFAECERVEPPESWPCLEPEEHLMVPWKERQALRDRLREQLGEARSSAVNRL